MFDKETSPVGRFRHYLAGMQEQTQTQILNRLSMKAVKALEVAKRRAVYEDQSLYVRDDTLQIIDRMGYLVQLCDLCSPYYCSLSGLLDRSL